MKIISRKSVLRFGLLLVLVGIAATALHFYWNRSAADYRKRLQARGEKLLIAEVIPPAVPAEQNSAVPFEQALALLSTNPAVLHTRPPATRQMVAPGRAMVGWRQPYVRSDTGSNSWEQTESVLSRSLEALELLRQMVHRPVLDFQSDDRPGTAPPLSHLEALKATAQFLSIAVVCDLHRSDTDSAVTNARALLALINGTKDERQVAFQVTRMALADQAAAVSWELLQWSDLKEEQLAALQRDWMELEFREAAERALVLERATSLDSIESLRRPIGLDRIYLRAHQAEDWVAEANKGTKELAWRIWWSYPDEVRMLRGYQVLLDNIRFAQTNYAFRSADFQQRSELAELGINTISNASWWELGPLDKKIRTLFSRNVAASMGYLGRLKQAEITRQMTLSAFALKRYQLRHGNYPPELASLVPEFIPSIPRDPVNGKPLRYQLIGKSFLLYSIGDDGVDNGGDALAAPPSESLAWLDGRDYVWPSPATDQEIQAYQKRLSFRPR
jgi:hypothetical protein